MFLFADNIILFTTDTASLQNKLEDLANYLYLWYKYGHKIHVNKTNIFFPKSTGYLKIVLKINNETVESVDKFK